MTFRPAIDVGEMDSKSLRLERTTDEKKQLELAAKVSPITHVSADDPPTLIIHGDADKLVPIQQAEVMVAKFKQVGVVPSFNRFQRLVASWCWWRRPGYLAISAPGQTRLLKRSTGSRADQAIPRKRSKRKSGSSKVHE
jgi:acetyl esterase/lipase